MKRAVVAALWFYTFWYIGSALSLLLGVSGDLGLVLGIAAGSLVAIDPRHVIWRQAVSVRN